MEELKYPIGQYTAPETFTSELLNAHISTIENFPEKLKREVENLTKEQLDTPYRPDGWTVIQVVNHCADSHAHAIIRVKLALTENIPTINPYRQELWAEMADGKMPVHYALTSLEGIHARWVAVLKSLTAEQWVREYIHPEKGRKLNMKEVAGSYAWHCEHHLAHIVNLKKRMKW